jgi:hypothetical protein
VKQCTLPGAEIDSDHNLLVAEVQKRLKAIIKAEKGKPKWNLKNQEKRKSCERSDGTKSQLNRQSNRQPRR